MIQGESRMNSAVSPPSPSKTRQNKLDATRACPLAFDEQLAEDRNERRGERRVGDEGAHRVRDQGRDLERVDRADGAEVVAGDDLADEPEDPREPGGEREDRRRPG